MEIKLQSCSLFEAVAFSDLHTCQPIITTAFHMLSMAGAYEFVQGPSRRATVSHPMLIGRLRAPGMRSGGMPVTICGSFWSWGSRFRVLSGRLEGRYSAAIEADRRAGCGWRPASPGAPALSDDVTVVGGSEATDAEAEQGVEDRCDVASALPAEHELVQVAALDGRTSRAMEGSETRRASGPRRTLHDGSQLSTSWACVAPTTLGWWS